jgi:hypothetical protein
MVLILCNRQLGHEWSEGENSLYLSPSKFLFIIATVILILLTLVGIKNIIMTILDTPFFNIIAKISFRLISSTL